MNEVEKIQRSIELQRIKDLVHALKSMLVAVDTKAKITPEVYEAYLEMVAIPRAIGALTVEERGHIEHTIKRLGSTNEKKS